MKISFIPEGKFPFSKLPQANPKAVSYAELDFRTSLIGMFLKVEVNGWDFYIPAIQGSVLQQADHSINLNGYIVAVKKDIGEE